MLFADPRRFAGITVAGLGGSTPGWTTMSRAGQLVHSFRELLPVLAGTGRTLLVWAIAIAAAYVWAVALIN